MLGCCERLLNILFEVEFVMIKIQFYPVSSMSRQDLVKDFMNKNFSHLKFFLQHYLV